MIDIRKADSQPVIVGGGTRITVGEKLVLTPTSYYEKMEKRKEMILGSEALQCLASFRIAVFGIGGAGDYAAESLARIGDGAIDLLDMDSVKKPNLAQVMRLELRKRGIWQQDSFWHSL